MKITAVYRDASAALDRYVISSSFAGGREEQDQLARLIQQCGALLNAAKVFDESEQVLEERGVTVLGRWDKMKLTASLAGSALSFKKQLDQLKANLARYESLPAALQQFIQTLVVPFLTALGNSEKSVLEQMMPGFVEKQRIYAHQTAQRLEGLAEVLNVSDKEVVELRAEEVVVLSASSSPRSPGLSSVSSASIASMLGEKPVQFELSSPAIKLQAFLDEKGWSEQSFTSYYKHAEPAQGFAVAYSPEIAHMILQMEDFLRELPKDYVKSQLRRLVGDDPVLQDACLDFLPWVCQNLEVDAEFEKFATVYFCAKMLNRLPNAELYEEQLCDCPIVKSFIGQGVGSCPLFDQMLAAGSDLSLDDSARERFGYADKRAEVIVEGFRILEERGKAAPAPTPTLSI